MDQSLPIDPPPSGSEAVGSSRLNQKLVAGLLGVSVLLMGVFVLGLWFLNRDELANENQNLTRLAVSLSEHTDLAFREIDIVLRETRTRLTPELMAGKDDSLHRLLHEKYGDLPQGQALLAFDAEGVLRGHSREFPAPRINSADRDYFQAQQSPGAGLFISAPLRNRVNNRWMISLSRRLSGSAGHFAGVVMAAVEVDYFARLYRALRLPEQARLDLVRSDGVVFACYPLDEAWLGKVRPAEENRSDFVTAVSKVPSLPLSVRLTLPKAVVLANWKRHTAMAAAGMLAMVAGVVALTATRLSYVRQLKHRALLLQQSEAALRESEQRYRTIVETSNEGICAIDAEMRVTYANRVVAEMLGCEIPQILGRRAGEFLFPEDMPRYLEELDHRRDNQSGHYEFRLRRIDGREVWVMISSTPILDEQGAFRGSFAMLTDITQRKEEQKYREGVEGILRHDLRSPLVSMSYIPALLQSTGELTPQQRLAVNELGRYAGKMLRMVDAYLGLSKLEKGAYLLEPRPMNMAGLLLTAAHELEGSRTEGNRRLELVFEGAPLREQDALAFRGEEVLCHAMLTNLMKNALEAAPEGSRVRVELRSAGQELEISVHNQGEVPEAIRERFFGKYVTAGKNKGTGLGAYSARLIAQAHGGSAELDASEPGATTVRVRLPKTPKNSAA